MKVTVKPTGSVCFDAIARSIEATDKHLVRISDGNGLPAADNAVQGSRTLCEADLALAPHAPDTHFSQAVIELYPGIYKELSRVDKLREKQRRAVILADERRGTSGTGRSGQASFLLRSKLQREALPTLTELPSRGTNLSQRPGTNRAPYSQS